MRGDALLPHYATAFSACELNNTFYQQPSEAKVRAWLAATPDDFRFAVKAQRGGSMRLFAAAGTGSADWLTGPYRRFGERLGAVLFRIPAEIGRNDERLRALLAAWPRDLPLAIEAQHPSWAVDETYGSVRAAGAAWVATETPEDEAPPSIIHTGPFLYLRLRRHDYAPSEIGAWAARLEPFLSSGSDAFVFFRHDPVGRAPELARQLADAVAGVASV
ncbi:MAG TPA: DUF72 domain-containing protein [Candidatus Limnocylindrales bacterium]|jgi:uncharacterized protein YecE (DUF72 family)